MAPPAAVGGPAPPGLPPAERATLRALVDALLPPVPPGAAPGGVAWPSASGLDVDAAIERLVVAQFSREDREQFRRLLRTVESPFLNLLLSGAAGRFGRMAPEGRERYLAGWARSRLAAKRRGFQAMKRLAAFLYYSRDLPGVAPVWAAIGYTPPAPSGIRPAPAHGPVRPTGPVEVSCDACVIGSGAGGAAVAARLAAAGHSVVILEAGPWLTGATFPRREAEAFDGMFQSRGLLTTRDLAFVVLAGETAGGSTTVNWMTCLEPSPAVRAEWEREGGVEGATGPALAAWLRAAADRIHVTDAESRVNPPNDVLRRGCEAMGYALGTDYEIIRRNAEGCDGRCGVCVFGCPWDAKRSALVTYLADALVAGARLYCRTRAESVETSGGKAVGVRAVYRDAGVEAPVHVRARAVVVAGGAVQTPALLLRSGVGPPSVGRGLRLHPTTAVFGEFPAPMRMWEGPMQTVVVRRFAGTDPGEHGPWLESVPAHPGLSALALPWTSAASHREQMARVARAAATIVLVRDVGEGTVGIDGEGRPRLDYRLTSRDRANLLRGILEAARIQRAAGAVRVATLHAGGVSVGDGKAPVTASELEVFEAEVRARGVRENDLGLYSAHPTGSARLGPDPGRAACRPTGEVHHVDGLWVADGSLLPTAPGVNPMLSIYALALRTAGFIDRSLRA